MVYFLNLEIIFFEVDHCLRKSEKVVQMENWILKTK